VKHAGAAFSATAFADAIAHQEVVRPVRLRSLDALRGIAIAAMILVNNQGGERVYAPLRHSAWNGCTPADLIFPFFLFVTGVAITFSMRTRPGKRAATAYTDILRRSALLFALGLFLNGFPLFDWTEMRFPGVLQRVALCYLAAAVAGLTLSTRALIATWSAVLLGYAFVSAATPDVLEPDVSLLAWVDDALLRGHLLHSTWDPEGVLSTLPAIATTLTGVLAGRWLRVTTRETQRLAGLGGAGVAGVCLGLLLDPWCPINKSLWSSSYVLFTGGAALLTLALCHWLIEIKERRSWALPFVMYGTNPIVVYVLSSLIAKDLLLFHVGLPDGGSTDLQQYLFSSLFAPWASAAGASLLFAVASVLVWLGVAAFLYRRGVLIKI